MIASERARALVIALGLLFMRAHVSAQQHPPAIHVDPPTVGPSLSAASYRRVFLRARPELARCLVSPQRGAPFHVRFHVLVHEDGRMQLESAEIPVAFARPDSLACLTDVIARTPAPAPPSGGGTVHLGIPLRFP